LSFFQQIFSIGSLIQNYAKCKSQKTLVWSHIVNPMKKDQQSDATKEQKSDALEG
jgi:hypothetical protein